LDGYIRFLLAVIVVMSHSGASNYLPSPGGGGAVQAFFVISGFYMAATYTKNYAGTLGIGFIASRFTRLYPSYILVFAAMFIVFLISDRLGWNLLNEISFRFFLITSSIWVKASVYSMIGQDFVGQNPATLSLLPIRQAWSISAEMAFYVLTPLLLRFHRYLVPLATAIIIYKFKVLNIDHDISAS
jgi:peptidoglycan/LPS O-acetylase OafA/YrhL